MEVYFGIVLIVVSVLVLLGIVIDSVLNMRRTVKQLQTRSNELAPEMSFDKNESSLPVISQQEFSLPKSEKIIQVSSPISATVVKNDSMLAASKHLIVLSVMARNGSYFGSYDLLQSISAAGFQYGAMNIFHYYEPGSQGRTVLFSLASANEPGEFDLNHIGDFSCSGLVLFMKLDQVPDAAVTFKMMFEKAEQLAEDLDGELRADPRRPWTEEIARQYRQKISQFQTASV